MAYRGERRVVLTSCGKPKAVLVSVEDYRGRRNGELAMDGARWRQWREESAALSSEILARRSGEPLGVDALWRAARADLEARDAQLAGD